MNWLIHPIVLEGKKAKLIPLERAHFSALLEMSADEIIWEHLSLNGTDRERLLTHLQSCLLKRATGEQYAFTIVDPTCDKIIGSTLFHSISPENRKIEIGWTWLSPNYWRTGVNRDCKLLLLTYCFETLKTIRVQFQANELNMRSRTAILGIGAHFEGILRNERIRENGQYRNTAMYSIIDSEWDRVKRLLQELGNKYS